jgi:hypothetical protein
MYNFTLNVVKIAFLLLYLRIFPGTVMRIVIVLFMVFVVLWTVVQAIVVGMTCYPIVLFIPSMEGKCFGPVVWLISAVISTVTDLAIFLLPVPSVLRLKLNIKTKISIICMFSLGLL